MGRRVSRGWDNVPTFRLFIFGSNHTLIVYSNRFPILCSCYNGHLKLSKPIKASQTKPTSTLDAAFVKRSLFQIPSDHQVAPRNPHSHEGNKKDYKMKEGDKTI